MSKMTGKKWNAMSSFDKYKFLSSGNKDLKSVIGIDGSSPVGKAKSTKYFWVEVGGVVISNKHKKESDAFSEADLVIEEWKDKSEDQG